MPDVTPIPKQPKRPKPKWGKKLPAKSERRYSENEQRETVRQLVYARDGGCVVAGEPGVGPCRGPDTPHHLRKASAGGSFTPDNLVTLCAFHNTLVEDEPLWARQRGLVVRGLPLPHKNPRGV